MKAKIAKKTTARTSKTTAAPKAELFAAIGTRGVACFVGIRQGDTVVPLHDPNTGEERDCTALALGTPLTPAWSPLGKAGDCACLWVSAQKGENAGPVVLLPLDQALAEKRVKRHNGEIVPYAYDPATTLPKYRGIEAAPYRREARRVYWGHGANKGKVRNTLAVWKAPKAEKPAAPQVTTPKAGRKSAPKSGKAGKAK